MAKEKTSRKGFTLIEMLIVIGIIAVLASIVLIAINPARQFKQAHDTQRISNVNAILNAIGQNIADNKGVFTCNGSSYTIASDDTDIKNGATNADLAPCVVPTYIAALPYDPTADGAKYNSNTDYDTAYTIKQDNTSGRITVSAHGEITNPISVTR